MAMSALASEPSGALEKCSNRIRSPVGSIVGFGRGGGEAVGAVVGGAGVGDATAAGDGATDTGTDEGTGSVRGCAPTTKTPIPAATASRATAARSARRGMGCDLR